MKIRYIQFFWFIFCVFFAPIAVSQENSPGLKQHILNYKNAQTDTARIRLLGIIVDEAPDGIWESYNIQLKKLCLKLENSKNKEVKRTALIGLANALNNEGYYFDMSGNREKAFQSYSQSLKIRRQTGDSCAVAQSLNNLGAFLEDIGEIRNADLFYRQSLALRLKCPEKEAIAESYNNLGNLAQKRGIYSEALDFLQRSLRMREELNDKEGMCGSLINLGLIYDNMLDDQESALIQYRKSLKLSKMLGDKRLQGKALDNMGVSLRRMAVKSMKQNNIRLNKVMLDSSLFYFKYSLEIREKARDNTGIAYSLSNLGEINQILNNNSAAEQYFRESLRIRRELGEKKDIAFSLNNLGNILFLKGDLKGARKLADEALKLSQEIGFPESIKRVALLQHDLFFAEKDYAHSLEMYKTYIKMRDSIQNQETRRQLVKQQYQFEYESKVKADSLLAVEEKKVIDARFRQERTQRFALYGGMAVLLLFGGLMVNRFMVIRKQKSIIEIKEMETQKQKQLVETQNTEILSSIEYAKRIQRTILPSSSKLFRLLPENFLIYMPKSIVAGDFYWLGSGLNTELFNEVVYAICDSTGHGVPGAMVSVVCSKALDKAYHEFKISDPGALLTKAAEWVVEEFSKNAFEDEEIKDGMDASVLCFRFDKETNALKEVLWAGANNPLVIISKDGNLTEIKPNKQPIGKSDKSESFSTHKIQVEKGDMLYLFTDGYADQFGGDKGKKLTKNAFKNLMLDIHSLPVFVQKERFESYFRTYQGSLEQIDDVCVAGIRI